MADSPFSITDGSPLEYLSMLDEVMETYKTDGRPEAIDELATEVERVAEFSGDLALRAVAQRRDREEMIACLHEVIASNITRKAFDI